MTLDEGLGCIRRGRGCANPIPAFMDILKTYELDCKGKGFIQEGGGSDGASSKKSGPKKRKAIGPAIMVGPLPPPKPTSTNNKELVGPSLPPGASSSSNIGPSLPPAESKRQRGMEQNRIGERKTNDCCDSEVEHGSAVCIASSLEQKEAKSSSSHQKMSSPVTIGPLLPPGLKK